MIQFPKHKCGLYLEHNVHKDYYQPISDYLLGGDLKDCFKDEASLKRAIETDNYWSLQWYPKSPVGFYLVAAPTFEECLSIALEREEND